MGSTISTIEDSTIKAIGKILNYVEGPAEKIIDVLFDELLKYVLHFIEKILFPLLKIAGVIIAIVGVILTIAFSVIIAKWAEISMLCGCNSNNIMESLNNKQNTNEQKGGFAIPSGLTPTCADFILSNQNEFKIRLYRAGSICLIILGVALSLIPFTVETVVPNVKKFTNSLIGSK